MKDIIEVNVDISQDDLDNSKMTEQDVSDRLEMALSLIVMKWFELNQEDKNEFNS
jgi:hypothetical protein